MPLDFNLAKTLPDSALHSAVNGSNPGLPGYLALAEIQRRSKLRATAPVQQPQQTASAGIMGMPPQSPQNAPGYANGGSVRHYYGGGETGPNGGTPDDNSDDFPTSPQSQASPFEQIGLVPANQSFNAPQTTYNPGYSPDQSAMTLAGARKGVQDAFGPDPGYQQSLSDIDTATAQGRQKYGLGDWIQNLVGHTLASKGSPMQAFGEGLLAANKGDKDVQQQNFLNSMAAGKDKLGIQKAINDRQSDIEKDAQSYNALQANIADAQARAKATNDSGNRDAQMKATEEAANFSAKRTELLQKSMEMVGNPVYANALIQSAKAAGKPNVAAYLQDAYTHGQQALMQQKQAESDIEQRRQQAIVNSQAAKNAALQNNMLDRQEKEDMFKMNLMLDPTGKNGGDIQKSIDAIGDQIFDHQFTATQIAQKERSAGFPVGALEAAAVRSARRQGDTKFSGIPDISQWDKFGEDMQKATPGTVGGQNSTVNISVNHVAELKQLQSAMKNNDNSLINGIARKYGVVADTPYAAATGAFQAISNNAIGEINKAAQGGQPHEAELERWHKILEAELGNKQLNAILDSGIDVAQPRFDYLSESAKRNHYKQPLLTPQTVSSLAGMGRDPATMKKIPAEKDTYYAYDVANNRTLKDKKPVPTNNPNLIPIQVQ